MKQSVRKNTIVALLVAFAMCCGRGKSLRDRCGSNVYPGNERGENRL